MENKQDYDEVIAHSFKYLLKKSTHFLFFCLIEIILQIYIIIEIFHFFSRYLKKKI